MMGALLLLRMVWQMEARESKINDFFANEHVVNIAERYADKVRAARVEDRGQVIPGIGKAIVPSGGVTGAAQGGVHVSQTQWEDGVRRHTAICINEEDLAGHDALPVKRRLALLVATGLHQLRSKERGTLNHGKIKAFSRCNRNAKAAKHCLSLANGAAFVSSGMNWARECAAIIPCHDEALNIEAVVSAVREFIPTVMVVDDGSRDGTAALAEAAGAQVLRHEFNRGKGAAIKTGLATAVTEGFDWALLLDGDGQHAAADIPAFWRCAEATGAQLVVGNRMGQAEAMRPVRRFVNRWMSRQLSRRTGQELPDTQCGFRLVHLASWSSAIDGNGAFRSGIGNVGGVYQGGIAGRICASATD